MRRTPRRLLLLLLIGLVGGGVGLLCRPEPPPARTRWIHSDCASGPVWEQMLRLVVRAFGV